MRVAVVHPFEDPNYCWVLSKLPPEDRAGIDAAAFPPEKAKGPFAAARGKLGGARRLWRSHRDEPFDLILSCTPSTAFYTELLRRDPRVPHVCIAFNFTDLPEGQRKRLFTGAYKRVAEFFVFTEAEQALYADAFGVPAERFRKIPWGVAPPPAGEPAGMPEGPYVSALGGEARDYKTLIEAAALVPEMTFVVIARPHNLAGLTPPANVKVFTNLPKAHAWGLVNHSLFHVLPLRSRDTPCGIVTIVGAMHLGKAQVVTEASGVRDYVEDGVTALFTAPGDAPGLAARIRTLAADPALASKLGAAAHERATEQFTESATIEVARSLLGSYAR